MPVPNKSVRFGSVRPVRFVFHSFLLYEAAAACARAAAAGALRKGTNGVSSNGATANFTFF